MKIQSTSVLLATIAMFTVGTASADVVNVKSVVDFTSPSNPGQAGVVYFPFRPTETTIRFTVAGKSCSLVSSLTGAGGGAGCNYNITVDAKGNITGSSNGNGCTTDIPAACN